MIENGRTRQGTVTSSCPKLGSLPRAFVRYPASIPNLVSLVVTSTAIQGHTYIIITI